MTRPGEQIMDPETERIRAPAARWGARSSHSRHARRGRRKRRRVAWLAAVLVLLGVAGVGGYLLVQDVIGYADFPGDGAGDVVVRVQDGDSTTEIGTTLFRSGVVASTRAFTRAAGDTDRIRSVQPGYYQLRLGMSGRAAVDRLLDPAARVGQLEIRGGVQLDDTRAGDGTVTPGVLTLISRATCARLDGRSTCITADELRATMAAMDPAQLGVPGWAVAEVRTAVPARRLEGLLAPGRYDLEPGRPAADVLRGLLGTSVARLEATGLVARAAGTGYSPYQLLVISSLVEKEGIAADFGKISRVLYNRLAAKQRLELDSTVNYPLDLQSLRTGQSDRARPGPYNTYLNVGLPPTPIAAASGPAVTAAIQPEPGPWLYFVRCRPDGTSCFASTLAEHQANVAAAEAGGVI